MKPRQKKCDNMAVKQTRKEGEGIEFMKSIVRSDVRLHQTLERTVAEYRRHYGEEGIVKFDSAIASLRDMKISNEDIETFLSHINVRVVDKILPDGREAILRFVDIVREDSMRNGMLPSEREAGRLLDKAIPSTRAKRTEERHSQADYHDLHDYLMIMPLGRILFMCGWDGKPNDEVFAMFENLIRKFEDMKLPNKLVTRIAHSGLKKAAMESLLGMDKEGIIESFGE